MQILLSSFHNPNFITITEYIESAIKNLNHELIRFDDRQHIVPGRIRQRIKSLQELDLCNINKQFVSFALDTKPDLVIVAGGHRIQAQSIKTLRENGIPVVLWTIDAPLNFDPIMTTARYYDHVFCGGTEAQEILEKSENLGTNWLPFACAPEFHHRVELTDEDKQKYAKDVVFVGSFYPNRWKILKELKEFEVGIWGPHWDKVPCDSIERLSIKNVELKHFEWIKIFSAAKIVIVIHFQDGKTPCHQASPKIYEALACKCFILVDRQKDVLSLFNEKEHLVSVTCIEDLKKKIRYYLEHSIERDMIAAKGNKEVLNKHTYVDRISEMISTIGSRIKQ